MSEHPLGPLLDLPPAESHAYLVALAEQEGAAALETLRLALEMPALAAAAIDALAEVPDQEAWDLLEGVVQSKAALRKDARRAQHRLRSRGFSPAAPARAAAPPAFERAQASFFDHTGAQFLRLVQPAPLGMLRYGSFIVSPEGLIECLYILANRSDVEGSIALEDEQFAGNLVEMGRPYIARRVQQAVARSQELKEPLPEDYFDAAHLLEGAPEDPTPPGLALSDQPVTPTEAHRLLRHRTMLAWLFAPEDMDAYVDEWLHIVEFEPTRIEEGLTNLGAIQARGRLAARIIGDLGDEATCRQLAEQLVEQARLLACLGEGDLADIAARSAAGLERNPPLEDTFLRALIDESMGLAVRAAMEEEEEEERGPWEVRRGAAGDLWVPWQADEEEGEDEEEPSAPRLWLPGQ